MTQTTRTQRRLSGYAIAFFGALAAFVPFAFQYNYVINAFYFYGAPYFDAGLFAHLVWHNDLLIRTPLPRSDFSYLGVHFSMFLMLVNLVSWCVHTGVVEFFSFFMACIYASLAAGMYAMLVACVRPERIRTLILLMALATAYSFNGIVMQGVWMPHFEYAIPSAILLFLLNLGRKNLGYATVFFLLALIMREDAGFHVAAALGVLTVLRFYTERRLEPVRHSVIFIVCAIAYSIFASRMTGQMRAVYGIQEELMRDIYIGVPPYAHLSVQLLLSRLSIVLHVHFYMVLAFFITLGWTIFTRNLFWIAGFVAYTPWFLFNLCAQNDNTGQLYAYYGFPLVICIGWPVIAMLWQYGKEATPAAIRQMLVLQTLLAIAGLTCWDYDNHTLAFAPEFWARWGGYKIQETSERREAIHGFAETLGGTQPLGIVMVDDNSMSLIRGSTTQQRGVDILQLDASHTIDTLVYFNRFNGVPDPVIVGQVTGNHLDKHYCIDRTPICLFTNHARDELGTLSSVLADTPAPPLK